MKVYFDNNILAGLQDGKISLPSLDGIRCYSSFAHFKELKEAGGRLHSLKDGRLQLLSNITKGRFLMNMNRFPCEPPTIVEAFCDYFIAFDSFCEAPNDQENVLKELQKSSFVSETREKLHSLGLAESVVVNNYSPAKLIKEYAIFLDWYVHATGRYGRYTEFQSLFNALEMIGYRVDKKDEFHANVSRSYDAEHAYYASFCDYFVTEDKGCLLKSNVAYSYWRYKTQAVSYNEFLKLI